MRGVRCILLITFTSGLLALVERLLIFDRIRRGNIG